MIHPSHIQFAYFPSDHATALAFYQQVIGLSVLDDNADETRLRLDASKTLTLFKRNGEPEPPSPRGAVFPLIEISREQAASLYARLDADGTRHGRYQPSDGLPLQAGMPLRPAEFWFEDPDGVRVSVYATREE